MRNYDLKSVVILAVGVLLIYPAALLSQLLLDAYYGDGEFIRLFMYESKRRLLEVVIADWAKSFILVAPTYLIILFLVKKIVSPLLSIILLLLSAAFIMLPQLFDIIPTMIAFIFSYIALFFYLMRRLSIV